MLSRFPGVGREGGPGKARSFRQGEEYEAKAHDEAKPTVSLFLARQITDDHTPGELVHLRVPPDRIVLRSIARESLPFPTSSEIPSGS